jgi:hypothetical protein
MKNIFKFRKITIVAALILAVNTSCQDNWLEPQPLSLFTPENTFTNEAGFKSALASCSANLKDEWYGDGSPIITELLFSEMAVEGTTDKFGPAVDLNVLITPDANLNSNDFNRIGWYWERHWLGIRLANTIIDKIPAVTTIKDDVKNQLLGKAYFYRSYHYYRLVNQFGDVPTSFKEISSPKLDFQTVKREAILTKIKADLDFAFKNVPFIGDKGDVNKASIGHLLTKVNLALGLYDEAIAIADQVINTGPYKLVTGRFGVDAGNSSKNVTWDLHRPANKFAAANTEVLFSVTDRFGLASSSASGTTSMRQAVPFFSNSAILTPDGRSGLVPGQVEFDLSTRFGRGIGRCRATNYTQYDVWDDENDHRHDTKSGNWMRMEDLVYNNPALKGVSPFYGKPLQLRDAAGKLLISNGDTIRNWYNWPHYKLYVEDQIRIPFQGGNSDWYVYRLAETYLLRAEAHWFKGNNALAIADLNAVRTRANCSPYPQNKVIDIGTILDERGRELYYEEPRKTELTRIAYQMAKAGRSYKGKTYSLQNFSTANFFYDRVIEKNNFYNKVRNIRNDAYTMSPYHVLWPIPRAAILANSLGQINQNIGYAGSESNKPALDKIVE